MQCTPKKLGHRWSETEKAKRETFVGRVLTRAVENYTSAWGIHQKISIFLSLQHSVKKKKVFLVKFRNVVLPRLFNIDND